MGSGDPPGLQNRREASSGVLGVFDSHTLPPATMPHRLILAGSGRYLGASSSTAAEFLRINLNLVRFRLIAALSLPAPSRCGPLLRELLVSLAGWLHTGWAKSLPARDESCNYALG